ncbi:MAG: class I SAM-dependent methyltransferase [Chloroflexi bacterium]|nr:class I SAM-dependent methyltransferase [Chloroflexota bacterium]
MFDSNKKPAGNQKLRGGYYTPVKLANYLAKWVLRGGKQRILEPSAGDGNFVLACLEQSNNGQRDVSETSLEIVAVEIEKDEIEKAKDRVRDQISSHSNVTWINGDFFALYESLKGQERFDAVVGNPPFIRFQYFDDKSRESAFQHLRGVGYAPTKLANAWVAFVQLSIELLREGGRLAMVTPAELLQVKYAAELRSRLSKQFDHIVLIGFKKLVFPEIQQEVVLLLAEGRRKSAGPPSDIHTIEYEDGDGLVSRGNMADAIAHVPTKHSRNGMKWTSLFLSKESFEALDEAEKAPGLIQLGKLAEVDIGVVTGRNSFFVVTPDLRKRLGVEDYTTPTIGRTSALTSMVFTRSDFEKYAEQYPAYLLNLVGVSEGAFPVALKEYIASGERERVDVGFKCRVRPRWFDVPSVYVPGGLMFRQIHRYPLLVLNEAQVTSTDTIHRVRFKEGVNPRLLAVAFFNSLTLAWAEVCGRSYGGGVLELEPREAEELPIPYKQSLNLDIEKADDLLRRGCVRDVLEYVDRIVLQENLGFDSATVCKLRNAWHELQERRTNRKQPRIVTV